MAALFRSSDRQKIIDFIIGFRIRDSGAELNPSTVLGKQIQRRVPLHAHAKLEELYKGWVVYWGKDNWTFRDGKSLKVGKTHINASRNSDPSISVDDSASDENSDSETPLSLSEQGIPPSLSYRLLVGSFHQPLDSIEEYFGEKIAFYFAWLQHCCFHLLYLSFVGMVVFICQFTSGNWDHPLRPFFSVFIMIWVFVVMVTWRQRANALACGRRHRIQNDL